MTKKKTQADLRAEYMAWTHYPDRCAICWIPTRRLDLRFNGMSLELAHIISRARGGDAGNVVGNVLLLCSSCHGAQHQSGYTYDGVQWPDIADRQLLRAKKELRELDVRELAEISGYTGAHIQELTYAVWPRLIESARLRWAK